MSTAYWSVDNAGVKAGDTVIVLGCGPVGLFTQTLCSLGRDHSSAYGARYNAFPLGDIFQRNVNIRSGQAPVIPYMPLMYDMVATGKINPLDVITHVIPLSEAKRPGSCTH